MKKIILPVLVLALTVTLLAMNQKRKKDANIECYDDYAIIIRTNKKYDNGVEYQTDSLVESGNVVLISSVKQMNDYIKTVKENYYFNEEYSNNYSLIKVVEKYDRQFFTDRELLVIPVTESSGSIRHGFDKIETVGSLATVHIERTCPEVGTCDMAYWFIFIEIDARKYEGIISFKLQMNTKDANIAIK